MIHSCNAAQLVSALGTFVLAMSLNPGIPSKAQREIDQVLLSTGKTLPDFEDEALLPYVTAIVKEVLRWNPVVPLGLCFSVYHFVVLNTCSIPS